MKKLVLILVLVLNTLLVAASVEKETNSDTELQKQLLREKKYAEEQTFYQGKDYDLKSFEVNKEALDAAPEMDIDYTGGEDDLSFE